MRCSPCWLLGLPVPTALQILWVNNIIIDGPPAMAFTTFVLFQLFNALNARSDVATAVHRDSLRNRSLWLALGVVLVLQVLAVHLGPVQRIFGTTSFNASDWFLCFVTASTVLWAEELRKLAVRRRAQTRSTDIQDPVLITPAKEAS